MKEGYGLQEYESVDYFKNRENYLKSLSNSINTRRDFPPRSSYDLSILSLAGIPKLYQDVEFEDFDFGKDKQGKASQKIISLYLKNLHDAFDSCVNLFIMGKNGRGKSYLSSLILKKAFENYYNIKMITLTSIINDVFSKRLNAEELAEYDFLCIDEVGKENKLESKANIFLLEQILRIRDQKGLPTIICTNLELNDFTNYYGDSVVSLLSQGAILQLRGEDKRKDTIINRDGFRKVMGWEDAEE